MNGQEEKRNRNNALSVKGMIGIRRRRPKYDTSTRNRHGNKCPKVQQRTRPGCNHINR